MSEHNNYEKELGELAEKIKQAEAQGKPVEKYILRQIEILQHSITIFLAEMEKEGRLDDIQTVEIEIRQYSVMRNLAQKINQPVEKYNELIKNAQCRVFGKENWENFFSSND